MSSRPAMRFERGARPELGGTAERAGCSAEGHASFEGAGFEAAGADPSGTAGTGASGSGVDRGGAARSSSEADRLVRQRARELGFARVGVARADEPIDLDHARYEEFLEAGRHGTMDYLADNREVRRRLDGASILAGARSVVCVADAYVTAPDPRGAVGRGEAGIVRGQETQVTGAPLAIDGIARYARGRDYHKHLRRRLRKLAAFMRRLGPDVRARPITDTAPVLERAWASRAGLGFIGKNGMLIAPGVGSFVLLGEIVTTLELTPDVPIGERCGSCVACLSACPTDAFAAPFVLDPRRCISYLTIELRGPIPEELRAGIGGHLFGCDVCQEVCPFNRAPLRSPPVRSDAPPARLDAPPAPPAPAPSSRRSAANEDRPAEPPHLGAGSQGGPPPAGPYAPLERWTKMSVEELASIDESDWEMLKECSPLGRATRSGLERNALTVLANLRDPRYRSLFARLASSHPDPVIREHAAWALGQLEPAAKHDREAPA